MIKQDAILVLCDGCIKTFSKNEETDARNFANKYEGVLYWRDDLRNSLVNQSFGTVESNANVIGLKIDRIG